MAGYTPVFSSMLEGTLYGRWPHTGVWACLLSMTDKSGEINKNPQLVANAIGVPIDQLLICIADFMAPDPDSQSTENEGRRLELIDVRRDWGWRVINHCKYTEKARLMGKAKRESESGKNADRLRDRRRPPMTAGKRLSDTDTDTDTDKSKNKNKIKSAFAENLPLVLTSNSEGQEPSAKVLNPPDPRKQLFDLGKSILGANSGGLISKAIASSSETVVGAILGEMAMRPTAEPRAYFSAAAKTKTISERFKTA